MTIDNYTDALLTAASRLDVLRGLRDIGHTFRIRAAERSVMPALHRLINERGLLKFYYNDRLAEETVSGINWDQIFTTRVDTTRETGV